MTVVLDPTLDTPSNITLDDLVARVRRKLSDRDNINKLSSAVDELATTITLKYSPSTIGRGTLLHVDDETLHVWEASSNTISVERGYDNSLIDYHAADAIVHIGGKSRSSIVDALNDELMSMSASGLYQMRSLVIDGYNAGTWTYELDEISKSNIYDVQYLISGTTNDWRHFADWSYSALDSSITFNCDPFWGTSARVLYKAPFTRFEDGGDDVQSDAGLQSEAADVLVWGALYRLTIGDEYIRDDFRTQGSTRRPSEVPAGAVLRSTVAGFKGARDERLSVEVDRLKRQFPLRRSGY